jgi:hypothetical protein
MRVYLAPADYTPTVQSGSVTGVGVSNVEPYEAYQIGEVRYNQSNSWQVETLPLPASLAGNTMTLMFAWRNDTFGDINPPVALDYVRIDYDYRPHILTYISPAHLQTDVHPRATFHWTYPTTGISPTHIILTISESSDMSSPVFSTTATQIAYPQTHFVLPVSDALTLHSDYYWRLHAVNSFGFHVDSPIWKFTTSEYTTPPDPAINPYPPHLATGIPLTPTLSWEISHTSAPVQRTHLVVWKAHEPDHILISEILDINITQYPILDDIFTFGTTYHWRAIPENSIGVAHATTWEFTTEPLNPPDIVTLTSPQNHADNIRLKPVFMWTYATSGHPVDLVSLTVSEYEDMSDPYFAIELPYPTTSFAMQPEYRLQENTRYFWRVRPQNTAGHPAHCAIWTFDTIEDLLPPIPAALVYPEMDDDTVSDTPTLVWYYPETAPGVDRFFIILSEYPSLASPILDRVEVPHHQYSYTVTTPLDYLTPYYWQVIPENEEGEAPSPPTWRFVTADRPPDPPQPLTYISPANASVGIGVMPLFEWSYAIGGDAATDVRLYISRYPDMSAPIRDIPIVAPATEYQVTLLDQLDVNTTFYWQAIPENIGGATPFGENDIWSFTTVPTLHKPDSAVPLYPPDEGEMIPRDITLSWDYDSLIPIDTFRLIFGEVTPAGRQILLDTQTHFSIKQHTLDMTLSYYTEYFWQVIPQNYLGDAENPPVWTFATEPFLPSPVILLTPQHQATEVNILPTYTWLVASDGQEPTHYLVQVSRDADFTYVVEESEVPFPLSTYTAEVILEYSSIYHWRVVPICSLGFKAKDNPIHYFTTIIETEITIDEETDVDVSIIPFGFSEQYFYSQSIYTARQIGAFGIITHLSWRTGETPIPATNGDITVYMTNVVTSGYTSDTDWATPINTLGWKEVYRGPYNIPALPANTWTPFITLDSPFAYNGITNLMIAVKQSGSDAITPVSFMVNSSGNSIYAPVDVSNSIMVVQPTSAAHAMSLSREIPQGETKNFVPMIRIKLDPLPPPNPPGSVTLIAPVDKSIGISEETIFRWEHPDTIQDGGIPALYIVQFSRYPDFRVYDFMGFVYFPGRTYTYRPNEHGGLRSATEYYWRVVSFNYVATTVGDEVWRFKTSADIHLQADQPGTSSTPLIISPNSFYFGHQYAYNQSIYKRSHIGRAGSITHVSWQPFHSNTSFYRGITLYMAHTPKSTFHSTADWLTPSTTADWTQVYSGPLVVNAGFGEPHFIQLQTPFAYNGSDNLLVATHRSSSSSPANIFYFHFEYTDSANNANLGVWTDHAPIDIQSPPTVATHDIFVQDSSFVPAFSLRMTEDFDPEIGSAIFEKYNLLLTNHPNPFNPSTTISYEVPRDAHTTLDIYNIKGQKVKSLVSGRHRKGIYTVEWNGTDIHGRQVASGVYLYHLAIEDISVVKKMVLMK